MPQGLTLIANEKGGGLHREALVHEQAFICRNTPWSCYGSVTLLLIAKGHAHIHLFIWMALAILTGSTIFALLSVLELHGEHFALAQALHGQRWGAPPCTLVCVTLK